MPELIGYDGSAQRVAGIRIQIASVLYFLDRACERAFLVEDKVEAGKHEVIYPEPAAAEILPIPAEAQFIHTVAVPALKGHIPGCAAEFVGGQLHGLDQFALGIIELCLKLHSGTYRLQVECPFVKDGLEVHGLIGIVGPAVSHQDCIDPFGIIGLFPISI